MSDECSSSEVECSSSEVETREQGKFLYYFYYLAFYSHNLENEHLTRKTIIDSRLRKAGWNVDEKSQVVEEFEIKTDSSSVYVLELINTKYRKYYFLFSFEYHKFTLNSTCHAPIYSARQVFAFS